MDWQSMKLVFRIFVPLAVIFYLLVIFGFRILSDDKDDDV